MANLEQKITDKYAVFEQRKQNLPTLKEKLKELELQFEGLTLRDNLTLFFKTRQAIEDLKKEIQDIQRNTSETDFLFTIMPIVKESQHSQGSSSNAPVRGIFSKLVKVAKKTENGRLYHKYLNDVERVYTPYLEEAKTSEHEMHTCSVCQGDLIMDEVVSDMVCTSCGTCFPYLGDTVANVTYNEEINLVYPTSFSYERINHFFYKRNEIAALKRLWQLVGCWF